MQHFPNDDTKITLCFWLHALWRPNANGAIGKSELRFLLNGIHSHKVLMEKNNEQNL